MIQGQEVLLLSRPSHQGQDEKDRRVLGKRVDTERGYLRRRYARLGRELAF